MFERYGANLVINATLKKYFYENLKYKFKDLKYHKVNKYLYKYNNQSYYIYHIFIEGNEKTIFKFHPILNCRSFDILNKYKNLNMITFESKNQLESIYKYKDLHFKMFEKCVKFFNIKKENVILHSSCAYTNIVLEIAERYPEYYSKYIIEEPMINFHNTINRSIKHIRFITPLLSKKMYPNCLEKIYKINNPVLILNSRKDKITTMKDCFRLLKQIECPNIKVKFITVIFQEDFKKDKKIRFSYKFRGTHANLFRSEDYYKTIENFI